MIDNKAFFKLSYGLFVLTTNDGSRDNGCIVNTAIQVADNKISVAVSKANYTAETIAKTKKMNALCLSVGAPFSVFEAFGFRSGRDTDKFEGIEPLIKGYLPIIPDAMSYITCKVIDTMETATHTVFLGEVTDAGNLKKDTPMTYKYYHEVIKGTAPKNAPTYTGD